MNIIKWTDDLSVGDPIIDEQHKNIINTASRLFNIAIKNGDSHIMKSILSELDNYIKIHFAHEEKYFLKYNYPKIKEHIEGHRSFEKKYNEIIDSFKDEDLSQNKAKLDDLIIKTINLLGPWVIDHIKKEITESNNFWIEIQKNINLKKD